MRRLQALALFGAFAAGCTAAPPPAGLELTLPDRALPDVPLRAMADPYFRIVVEGAGMAPVEVTGLPGESVRIEVEPGAARLVRGELYSEPGATLPTHLGEAGPFDLAADEERTVDLDLWRLPAPAGFGGWLKLAAGRTQTCGIDADGELWCWGFNPGALVVDAAAAYVDVPARFSEPGPFADVAVGDAEVCAAKQAGGVFCVGRPVDDASDGTLRTVNGLPGPIVSLAAGTPRFCGAASDGTVWCWNAEYYYGGEMQGAPAVDASVVSGVSGAVQIVSTIETSSMYGDIRATFCARTGAGAVRCWGDNENYGQLGAGLDPYSVYSVSTAAAVALPSAARDLAVGGNFACALLASDDLYCWGEGFDGLTGLGLYAEDVSTPAAASTIMGSLGNGVTIVDIAASGGDGPYGAGGKACILRSDGELGCWGTTADMVAYGNPVSFQASETPILFDLGGHNAAVAQIVAGAEHTCWRYVDGQAACIGGNHYGQRGITAARSSDVPVPVDSGDWIDLAVNERAACGIKADGTLWCWGDNANGQLGIGQYDYVLASVAVPTQVGTQSGWTKIVGGGAHFCAMRAGTAHCWGLNGNYETVPGSPTYGVTVPTLVSVGGSVLDIFAGPRATCARVDNTVVTPILCWGQDDYFTGENRFGLTGIEGLVSTPAEVAGPGSNALSIAIMERGSCVLGIDNVVSCMGTEQYGEIGNGGAIWDSAVPATPVVTGYAGISAGGYGVCAWTAAGSVKCWGSNEYGALGFGTYGTIWEYATPEALPFSATTGLKDIVFGRNYDPSKVVCGLTGAGALYCWGSDEANADPYVADPFSPGALGLGAVDPIVDTPQGPVAGGPWRKVGVGDGFSCAIETPAAGGDLFCWGWNRDGRLGTGVEYATVGDLVATPVIEP